jgi:ABC-type nitrate/sulfonate/bicarbonate transport system substrate-binding protein
MNLVLMVHSYTNGWTALRFAVEANRTQVEGPMVVYVRITVVLLLSCVVPSSVIAQEKPKLFLGASSKTLGYSPLWVGARKGFFEQQGLDVQLVLLRGMPMTVQALSAGSLHIGSGGR